jgi:hypothetical protein
MEKVNPPKGAKDMDIYQKLVRGRCSQCGDTDASFYELGYHVDDGDPLYKWDGTW